MQGELARAFEGLGRPKGKNNLKPTIQSSQPKATYLHWVILGILFLASVNNYLDRQALSVLKPILQDESALGISEIEYSYIVMAFLLAYAIMYTGSGKIIDVLGGRMGVAYCLFSWSVVAAGHALSSGWKSLCSFRFLLGLSEPGLFPGGIKTISRFFPVQQRGLAISFMISGISLGAIIAPLLIIRLEALFGWRMTFVVTGLSGFLLLILWLLIFPKSAETDPEALSGTAGDTGNSKKIRWRDLFKYSQMRAFFASRFVGDPAWYFILFWLPGYLVNQRGFSIEFMGGTTWIPYIGMDIGLILGGLLAGYLIRRTGKIFLARKTLLALSGVLAPAGILCSQYDFANPYFIILSLAVGTFAMGLYASAMHSLPSDLFPFHVVASVYGLGGTAGAIGGFLFSRFVGELADRDMFTNIFIISGVMYPVSILIMWFFMKPIPEGKSGDSEKETP